jgi:hypothetical protein
VILAKVEERVISSSMRLHKAHIETYVIAAPTQAGNLALGSLSLRYAPELWSFGARVEI